MYIYCIYIYYYNYILRILPTFTNNTWGLGTANAIFEEILTHGMLPMCGKRGQFMMFRAGSQVLADAVAKLLDVDCSFRTNRS